jgi:hypothetical protein
MGKSELQNTLKLLLGIQLNIEIICVFKFEKFKCICDRALLLLLK